MGSDMRVLRASWTKKPPDYGDNSPFFTIEIHHGGDVEYDIDDGTPIFYTGGKVSYFDFCNMQLFTIAELHTMVEELGYDPNKQWYFMMPEPDQWQTINSDSDVELFIASRVGVLYVFPNYENPVELETQQNSKVASTNSRDSDSDSEDETIDIGAFSDSDYEHDDLDFLKNVDVNAEWGGFDPEDIDDLANAESVNQVNYETDPEIDESDLERTDSSEDEGGRKKHRMRWPKYKDTGVKSVAKFELGMMFPTAQALVEAIRYNSVRDGREIKFIKSERTRVRAICTKSLKLMDQSEVDPDDPLADKERVGCEWMVFGSLHTDENNIQIKTLNDTHTCARSFTNKNITGKWLGEFYLEKIRTDPKWKLQAFKDHVMQDLQLHVSKTKLYRAKQWAKLKLMGSLGDQYLKLYQYAEELRRTNQGSTIQIVRDNLDRKRFLRIYVGLAALREGMKKHCRPLIGLDGCHLWGATRGVLLTAVGIDPNNAMYPISYAVVESENKASWKWFLELLKDDLSIENSYGWTFITDKQKGLMPAIEDLFPNSEHRCCVRHLYNNFKTHYKGMQLMNIMYAASRSTTVPEFKEHMAKLAKENQEAANWLSEKPPAQWCKAYFDTFVKSDMVLNNMCESFNAMILDATGMPIISMLERIKSILMKRVQVNKGKMVAHKGLLCPKIEKIIEKIKHEASFCTPEWAGNSRFQVSGPGGQFVCDLEAYTCACRKWDLNGIPCRHGVAAMVYSGFAVEQFVHECYKTKNCLDLYSNYIEPTNGSQLWPESTETSLEPPIYAIKPGQSQHKRRLEEGEKRKKARENVGLQPPAQVTQKLGRKFKSMVKCTSCGAQGHNKRTCGKFKVKTRKPRRRRTGETNNDTQQSEIPHAPVQRTCETEFGNNFQDAFQGGGTSSPSFLDMYQRSFGSVMGSQGGGTSSNSEVPTVMQRQARLSQPTNDAPRTVSSRGEKLMFSSQPRS